MKNQTSSLVILLCVILNVQCLFSQANQDKQKITKFADNIIRTPPNMLRIIKDNNNIDCIYIINGFK